LCLPLFIAGDVRLTPLDEFSEFVPARMADFYRAFVVLSAMFRQFLGREAWLHLAHGGKTGRRR
jgi:hypothetical protein